MYIHNLQHTHQLPFRSVYLLDMCCVEIGFRETPSSSININASDCVCMCMWICVGMSDGVERQR